MQSLKKKVHKWKLLSAIFLETHKNSLTVISVTGEITPVYGTPAEQMLV